MAYNPATGQWDEQDESVETRVTGLLSKNNPLMRQAATQGMQAANSRGLLNSSMGVQAAQASRVAAAMPIASQEASQAAQANRQGREHQLAKIVQQNELAAQDRRQSAQFQFSADQNEMDRAFQDRSQSAQFQFSAGQNEMDRALQQKLQGLDLASRERMQQFDLNLRQSISALDRDAQERIAQMNVSASERHYAASLAASLETNYAQIVSNIMANPDLPADVRQGYLDFANQVRGNNLALIEQMYNFQFDFAGGAQPTPGQPAQPAPATPPSSNQPVSRGEAQALLPAPGAAPVGGLAQGGAAVNNASNQFVTAGPGGGASLSRDEWQRLAARV